MKKYTFRPLQKMHIPSMSPLLFNRQLKEIESFPFLKTEKLNESFISNSLEKMFQDQKVIGTGAFENEELVGYLFAQIKFDETRGKHAWVPYEGVAIKLEESGELIRLLYAETSKEWLDYGCYAHYAIAPMANFTYVDAFQRLSFGFEQVQGVLDIESYQPFNLQSNIKTRMANLEDREVIGSMADIISSYQNESPVYAVALPEYIMEIRDGYRQIVDDEDAFIVLAEQNGEPIGFQAYWTIDSHLAVPEHAIELSVAGTFPHTSGKGIGKTLMDEAIRVLKEKNIKYIMTDWRMTNLSSSVFWPKCGFQPFYHRMHRIIDPRLGWANFRNPLLKK
ncbi:GNAT family N-acetyltransferase [Neobacillus sp. D3-1R]|uniref:GNAT family N-acetyltransferase n=1 Tax=Neobacillus sp. D3-1R TaxID=3445778 RepID=UPI003F9EBBAE